SLNENYLLHRRPKNTYCSVKQKLDSQTRNIAAWFKFLIFNINL
ncbi:unnamed protein product, partial [Brassica oleracea var. botrytis]